MEDDGREERGRRARRAAWAFRLAFYGGAAAVALALIAARGSGGGATPWVGATVDGTPVSIEPGHDGRARGIDLQVTATCPWTGETWPARWWVDADRVPFERHGDRIHVYESWTERFRNGTVALNEFTIDLWIAGDSAEGVIKFTERGYPESGPSFTCRGGPVRFTAQR